MELRLIIGQNIARYNLKTSAYLQFIQQLFASFQIGFSGTPFVLQGLITTDDIT